MARTAVVAGTASAVVGHSQDKRQQKQMAAEVAQAEQLAAIQQQAPAPPPAAAAAPAQDDMVAKLKELADLKAAGVLDDAEFAAAKAKLLAS